MSEYGMEHSKWATSTYRSQGARLATNGTKPRSSDQPGSRSAAERRQQSELQAYSRVLKCLRRLKWRSTLLMFCYQRALVKDTSNVIGGINFEITSDTGRANAAEIMFQADFFEFYTLLERGLVWLLECFGMVITANSTTDHVPLPQHGTKTSADHSIIGDSWALRGSRHRFHSNVLAALDKPTSPLYSVLGNGAVRQYLGLAKEFRNRFKGAELEESDDTLTGMHRSHEELLASLKLDDMLARILLALEEARSLASQHLAEKYTPAEVEMISPDEEATAGTAVIDDAMDWD